MERTAREARLAAALRDTLLRRKEQARTRTSDRDPANVAAEPHDARREGSGATG